MNLEGLQAESKEDQEKRMLLEAVLARNDMGAQLRDAGMIGNSMTVTYYDEKEKCVITKPIKTKDYYKRPNWFIRFWKWLCR